MKSYQYETLEKRAEKDKTKLYLAAGKNKGKFATYVGMGLHGGEINLRLEDKTEITVHYRQVEELSVSGEPEVKPVIDMTGREINIGSYICYSRLEYKRHAMEIGRVTDITEIGYLKVRPLVHNGEKIVKKSWRRCSTNIITVNDAFGSIKLP